MRPLSETALASVMFLLVATDIVSGADSPRPNIILFIEWPGDNPVQAESDCQLAKMSGDEAERQRYYGFGIGYEPLYNIGKPSFDRLPHALCIEGPRRGVLPEVFLKHYQLRGLIWEEDLYRSAVVNEIIADWTLSAFLTYP